MVAVWLVVLLFWGGAVCWLLADSVVGWVSRLGGGVGGMSVIGLASGWLVGRPVGGGFAWFGWCV